MNKKERERLNWTEYETWQGAMKLMYLLNMKYSAKNADHIKCRAQNKKKCYTIQNLIQTMKLL